MLLERCRLDTGAAEDHIGVDSYWEEYRPLLDEVKNFYRPEFGLHRLFLEEKDSHDALKTYIRFLLSSATGVPTLQFNRVDFRLPWLRAQFPQATLIHVYRDVREQWMSTVEHLSKEAWDDPFENTPYDLIVWSSALAQDFPFLFSTVVRTAYHRHYLLWKLSQIMGRRCSDLSISFDRLVESPQGQIDLLMKTAGLVEVDIKQLKRLIFPPKRGQWRGIVDEAWFLSAEKECDDCLDQLGLIERLGIDPLKQIKNERRDQWRAYEASGNIALPLLSVFRDTRAKAFEIYQGTEPYVQAVKRERDGLTGLLLQAEKARDGLAEQLKGVEDEREELKGRLQDVHTERDGLAGLLQRAEDQQIKLSAQLKSAACEREALEGRLHGINTERDGLEGLLQQTQYEQERLGGQLKAAEKERKDLNNLLTGLMTEREGLAGLLQQTEFERDELTGRLKHAEIERKDLENCLHGVNTERDGLAGLLQSAEHERDQLADRLEIDTIERKDLENRLHGVNTERDGLAGLLQSAEHERDQLARQLKSVEKERENLNERLHSAHTEQDELLALLKQAGDEREALVMHLKGVEEERDELRRQLSSFPVNFVANLFTVRRRS